MAALSRGQTGGSDMHVRVVGLALGPEEPKVVEDTNLAVMLARIEGASRSGSAISMNPSCGMPELLGA